MQLSCSKFPPHNRILPSSLYNSPTSSPFHSISLFLSLSLIRNFHPTTEYLSLIRNFHPTTEISLSSPYKTPTSPRFHSIQFLSSSGDLFLHMGTCLSTTETESASYSALTASVISANGALRQYPLPINASQVLGLETTSPSSFFICNSDNLYFDEHIPPLDSAQQLDAGQIYFVLPVSRLQYPLAAREMAAMAVKASLALVEGSKKNGKGRRRRRTQISPLCDLGEKVLENEYEGKTKSFEKMERDAGVGGRSKYLKRVMSRSASRKGKVGQRPPFRATLSTIHEGFVAE